MRPATILLEQMREWCDDNNLSLSYLCQISCGNSKLAKRLEGGSDCEMDTAAKIKRFMRENPIWTGR